MAQHHEAFSNALNLTEAERQWVATESRYPMTTKTDFKQTLDAYKAPRGGLRGTGR